ncbi:MAG: Na(+)-translocating NADH-quinone reductase subunit A [Bacteroidales bacterium]|nr:Na(+)-translocating NADH-quinone reductase subunit A [Deltaproteobacteria bacterium]MBL7137969.1 Na(+)-translocating NADH-quinone reductase subunit A [Bacteroidales bacterium]
MSATIKIKKGLDIQLIGKAVKNIITISPQTYASKPIDFIGVFPKVLIQEGEEIQAGTPLYSDKYREQIIFTAPVSGKVKEIRRGAKRVLLEIIIEAGETLEYVDYGMADPNALMREQIIEKMLKSGVWPVIRQRPYSIIARAEENPKAIFISAFDTSPLASDYNFIVEGQAEAFQAGIDALRKLTSGKVHLNVLDDPATSNIFLETKGVQINRFMGPHPTGNVSTQISRLDPINRGDVAWYLRPQEVLMIGRLFLSGKYDATKLYALTGSMIKKPAYYKSLAGASIHNMVTGNTLEGKPRYISGNVLTGTRIIKDGFAGFYDSQITVIPEGDYFEFFGWATPGFNKFSFYSQFLSGLWPKKKYSLDTNLHGGERAFVMTGQYEKVFPFDIFPLQLIKAIMIEDIDLMENLGIYEIDAEDFALIEFMDTSKMEIQSIVRKGLDLMQKETT